MADTPEADREAAIRRLYREVELAVRRATLVLDHDGVVVMAHKAGQLLGMSDADLVGGPPVPEGWQLCTADGEPLPLTDHPAFRALRAGHTVVARVGLVAPDGVSVRLRMAAHVIHDDPDHAVDLVIEEHDRRDDGRARVEEQERRFRTLTDMLPVAVYEASPAGEITYVNPAFTMLTGYQSPADVPDLPMLEIVHPDDLVGVLDAASRSVDAGEYTASYRVLHVDGTSRWVRSRLSLLVDDQGVVSGYVGTIEDVDDLERARAESRLMVDIVESASDQVAVFEDDRLVYLNPAARALIARTEIGSDPSRSVASVLEAFNLADLDESLDRQGAGRWAGDVQLNGADGNKIHVSLAVTTSSMQSGSERIVVIGRDIEDQKRREKQLAHHATHDPLTGLANRTLLDRRVAERGDDDAGLVVVFFADIDRFKMINDQYGHAIGDAVIVEVAARLASVVRSGDLVARAGGDEIVGWCTSVPTPDDIAAMADRLVDVVRSAPIRVGEQTLDVTVSVGIASSEIGDSEALVGLADRALYEAKRSGRNCWRMATEAAPNLVT